MSPPERRAAVPVPRRADAVGDVARDLVVVAVDGSEASVRAMVWALKHAARLGLRVEALTAWPLHGPVFLREVTGHFSEPRWRAREAQAAAVSRALAAVDDAPPYDLRVVNADVVDALTRAGAKAVLVVTGSDGPADGSAAAFGRSRITERLRQALGGLLVVVGPESPAGADAPTEAEPVAGRPSDVPGPR